ncbi:unknown [Collinsella sp. CAG:289]|nr:unknown [Collinsella sp. CAG:289]
MLADMQATGKTFALRELKLARVLIGPARLVVPASRIVGASSLGQTPANDDGILAEVVYGKCNVLQSGLEEYGLGECEGAFFLTFVCEYVVVVDENYFVNFSADGQLKGLNFFGESDNALGMLGGVCIDDVPSSEKSRSYL